LDQSKGGLFTFIRHEYISFFDEVIEHHIFDGRIFVVELKCAELVVMIVNVHLEAGNDHEDGKIDMLEGLHDFLHGFEHAHIFAFGDWNFVLDKADRINIRSGDNVGKMCKVGQCWCDHFNSFDELHQPDATRFPGFTSVNATAARLDRLYQTAYLENYALLDIKTSTVGIFKDTYLSDHLPVLTTISEKQIRNMKVKPDTAKDPRFIAEVQAMVDNTSFSTCCWARLLQVKEICLAADKSIKVRPFRCGPLPHHERIYWCLLALKSNLALDHIRFSRACSAYPDLVSHGSDCSLPVSAECIAHIRQLLGDALESEDEQIRKDTDCEYTDCQQKTYTSLKARLTKSSLYNPNGRKLGVSAVRDDYGNPITNRDDAII